MIDIDDFDDVSDEDFEDGNIEKEEPKIKRDIRAEIEKRLELLQLRKLTGDFYDEEIFN